jgi:predicted aspartyl protease
VFTLSRISGSTKIAAVLLATAVLAPSIAEAQQRNRRAPVVHRNGPQHAQFQALPLERSAQNHLLVRAFINGRPALLGVDSGAPVSAVSINRVRYFGLAAAGPDAEVPSRLRINGRYAPVMVARGLRLGSLNLVEKPLVALDLSGSSTAAKMMKEQAIDGILGADVLFPTHALLDCRNQVLILKVDPSVQGGVPGMDFSGLSGIPMHVTPGDNLYVDGTVNGKRAKLMVDTGAFGTLLHQPFVRRMKIPTRDTQYVSAGVNMKHRGVQLAMISRMSIGSVQMRSKQVGVIDLEGLIRKGMLDASPPVAGLLGAEILQDHSGIIDFRTKTLYLRN